MKVRYSSEVVLKQGRITTNNAVGTEFEQVIQQQLDVIKHLKPLMNKWIRNTIDPLVENATLLIKTRYNETSTGLSVEFKVQSVVAC